MKKNENGFSAIELILVLVIVGLIVVVGWFVFDRQKNKKDDSTNQSTNQIQSAASSKKPTTVTNPSDSWLKYTSQNNKYSMALPDGWHLLSTKGSDDIYAFGAKDVIFMNGEIAKVKVVDNGGDGMVFWLVYGYKNNKGFSLSYQLGKSEKVKTYTNSNGIAVNKYSRTQTAEPADGTQEIAKGTVEYIYDLTTNDFSTVIIYDVRPGETNQTQYLEDAIATFKFI